MPVTTNVVCFCRLSRYFEASCSNSVDPEETVPVGTIWSVYTLFAYILKLVNNIWQLFIADDFSRQRVHIHLCHTDMGESSKFLNS